MSKLVCWALFDSETGDYMSTVHHYFEDKIDVYGVGISHYGKDTNHYVNFNLADFSELFGAPSLASRLLKALPKPDIIVASPPCESWSHMTSINNGNIHWKRYASKLFPENKIFQLQDVDVQSGFVKANDIKTFYTRVNGELCHQNTWDIIKKTKPSVFMVENPDNYSWEYIPKYVVGGGTTFLYEQISLLGLRAIEVLSKARDFWIEHKTKAERFCDRQKWQCYQSHKRQEWVYLKRLWYSFKDTGAGAKRLLRTSYQLYRGGEMTEQEVIAEIKATKSEKRKADLWRCIKKIRRQNGE